MKQEHDENTNVLTGGPFSGLFYTYSNTDRVTGVFRVHHWFGRYNQWRWENLSRKSKGALNDNKILDDKERR